eukprot:CAMPEP_0181472556 /NCGR_PEP_ID=MMETSP1110-20121109/39665_1 /TAXON_ID=174948 /ORGANISM="Symbiodinium sp., Strain CCMP421" /LENGTH=56 /DNA_ID=CAMNT_0023597637 /DNA_START=36 /DNA_END=206 /DNA_ORIENTATION=-
MKSHMSSQALANCSSRLLSPVPLVQQTAQQSCTQEVCNSSAVPEMPQHTLGPYKGL